MIEASLMLLSEWYVQQQKVVASWQSEMSLQIFCSFLDRTSLELARIMVNAPFAGDDPDHELFLQIVFLPICRSMRINQELKQEVQQLLQTPLTDPHYHLAITAIVRHALDVVGRIRQVHHAQLMDILVHPRLPHTPQFQENRILFGTPSAQFLEKYTLLPQVRINHRIYNGIPFGLDVSSFVQRILKLELIEQGDHVRMQNLPPIELHEQKCCVDKEKKG